MVNPSSAGNRPQSASKPPSLMIQADAPSRSGSLHERTKPRPSAMETIAFLEAQAAERLGRAELNMSSEQPAFRPRSAALRLAVESGSAIKGYSYRWGGSEYERVAQRDPGLRAAQAVSAAGVEGSQDSASHCSSCCKERRHEHKKSGRFRASAEAAGTPSPPKAAAAYGFVPPEMRRSCSAGWLTPGTASKPPRQQGARQRQGSAELLGMSAAKRWGVLLPESAGYAEPRTKSGDPLLSDEILELAGRLSDALPPAPAPEAGAVPREFELFDMLEARHSIEIGHGYRVQPPTRPSLRHEAVALTTVLEQLLDQAGDSTGEALLAWDRTFGELVRQVFVHCAERGMLLGRVRRAYSHYLSELLERLVHLEESGRERQIRELQQEVAELRAQLGETQNQNKRSIVVGKLTTAASRERHRQDAADKAELERAQAEGKQAENVLLAAAAVLEEQHRQGSKDSKKQAWRDLLGNMSAEHRAEMLFHLFAQLPDEMQVPEALRLFKLLGHERRSHFLLNAMEQLPGQERVGFVERQLRLFSRSEMDIFCDFLQWVWGDSASGYCAKLVANLSEPEREQMQSQLEAQLDAPLLQDAEAPKSPLRPTISRIQSMPGKAIRRGSLGDLAADAADAHRAAGGAKHRVTHCATMPLAVPPAAGW